ncbi:MAG: ABC transporter ATP-binding protein [Lachnospiraceae bacterium]
MQPIEIDHVTKDFGQGRGVFDISFSVKEGEVFGYLGPNGAGKSTTIRQLLGFVKPDKGSLQILGMDCFRQAAEIHKHIGYLAGEIAFVENMKGMEYIQFIAQLRGMKDDTRMKELIEMFELNPTGKIRKMSKGMKQKIALVTAFMDSPEVIILDEPTSGLDPLMQNRFVDLILEEKKKGTTILMSSHIFEEVERTCDRTAIIRQGEIVDTVDMAELSKIRNQVYTVTLASEEQAVKLSGQPELTIQSVEGAVVKLLVNNNVADSLKVLAQYEPVDLQVATQSLEDVFLHYYGKGEEKDA